MGRLTTRNALEKRGLEDTPNPTQNVYPHVKAAIVAKVDNYFFFSLDRAPTITYILESRKRKVK